MVGRDKSFKNIYQGPVRMAAGVTQASLLPRLPWTSWDSGAGCRARSRRSGPLVWTCLLPALRQGALGLPGPVCPGIAEQHCSNLQIKIYFHIILMENFINVSILFL